MLSFSTTVDKASGKGMFEVVLKRPLKGETQEHYSFNPAGGVVDVIAAKGENKQQGEVYVGDCGGDAGYGCYHGPQQKTKGQLTLSRTESRCVCAQDCTPPAVKRAQADQAAIDAAQAKADQAKKAFEAAGCVQDSTLAGCDTLKKQVGDAERDVAKATETANTNAAIAAAKDKADQATKAFDAAGCTQDPTRVGCDTLKKQLDAAKNELGTVVTTTVDSETASASSGGGLSAGAVVGIVIAVIIILGVIAAAVYVVRSVHRHLLDQKRPCQQHVFVASFASSLVLHLCLMLPG